MACELENSGTGMGNCTRCSRSQNGGDVNCDECMSGVAELFTRPDGRRRCDTCVNGFTPVCDGGPCTDENAVRNGCGCVGDQMYGYTMNGTA